MTANDVLDSLQSMASKARAKISISFFKTGVGQYGEGDQFLGVTVPDQRTIARQFRELALDQVGELLNHPYHEARLTGCLILTLKMSREKDLKQREVLVKFYLSNLNGINNWDLVDSSAPLILGQYALENPAGRKKMRQLLKSSNLWHQRIAILSELTFIRSGQCEGIYAAADAMLDHDHDLIHKAVGWMLREAGKKDEPALRDYLDAKAIRMPRTMLRYAIERLPEKTRKHYLNLH